MVMPRITVALELKRIEKRKERTCMCELVCVYVKVSVWCVYMHLKKEKMTRIIVIINLLI